jgi:hypothetical protein
LVLVGTMVAIIGLVVCQDEEFIVPIRTTSQPEVIRGAPVGMVYMVAIGRCFGVADRRQPKENKGTFQHKSIDIPCRF